MWVCARFVGAFALLAAGCVSARNVPVREPQADGEQHALDARVSHYRSDAAPKTGPQRLARTITLGSVVDTSRAPTPAAPLPGPAPATLQPNTHVQPSYGYSEIPVFAPAPSAPPPRESGSSSVQPGQDFPAPPSHGPAFPFQSSPASPWETGR
jgi:hypothetical protein